MSYTVHLTRYTLYCTHTRPPRTVHSVLYVLHCTAPYCTPTRSSAFKSWGLRLSLSMSGSAVSPLSTAVLMLTFASTSGRCSWCACFYKRQGEEKRQARSPASIACCRPPQNWLSLYNDLGFSFTPLLLLSTLMSSFISPAPHLRNSQTVSLSTWAGGIQNLAPHLSPALLRLKHQRITGWSIPLSTVPPPLSSSLLSSPGLEIKPKPELTP